MIHDLSARFIEETQSLYNLGIFVPKTLNSDRKKILLFAFIPDQFGKLDGTSEVY